MATGSTSGGDQRVVEVAQGYFSLLRWRRDATRDEARNVAVLLVEPDGRYGGIRSAPLSSISSRLSDQGLLDDVIVGLEERFESDDGLPLRELVAWSETLTRSLVITPPRPVAVEEPEAALDALYRAFVAPQRRGSRAETKFVLLDRVMKTLRKRGVPARRGERIEDFIFDLVVSSHDRPTVYEVLSFATARKDWTPVERDAGHFLYAVGQLKLPARAVISPPAEANGAADAYNRVSRWFDKEKVERLGVEDLAEVQLSMLEG
jgi:hypothetical protein